MLLTHRAPFYARLPPPPLSQRFKNVMAELETLHRLEAGQLEHFLTQQVLAGKQAQSALKKAEEPVFAVPPPAQKPKLKGPSPPKRATIPARKPIPA